MGKEKSFEEQKAEQLLKELCGDFLGKEENLLEDLDHDADKCLIKEDKVFLKAEYEVLKLVEEKLKKFLEEKKRVFE